MNKLYQTLFVLTISSSFAIANTCVNLSGRYQVQDLSIDCQYKNNFEGPSRILRSDFPMVKIIGTPGPGNYGNNLISLGANGFAAFEISQKECDSLTIQSTEAEGHKFVIVQEGKNKLMTRSAPLYNYTKMSKKVIKQKLKISKFTTISAGVATVFKNIDYRSKLYIDKNNDLKVVTTAKFEGTGNHFEMNTCIFKRE